MRSYIRKAKIIFFIIWAAVALLAATVLVSKWEPKFGATGAGILALITGGLIGLVPACLIAALVAAWPVLRAIWWWLPELAVTGGLATGWVELAGHTALVPRLLLTAAHGRRPGCYRAGAARHLPHGLVPGQQAPHPHLFQRVHHHQPHRQPAADPRCPPDPGRGTDVGLAPARTVPG